MARAIPGNKTTNQYGDAIPIPTRVKSPKIVRPSPANATPITGANKGAEQGEAFEASKLAEAKPGADADEEDIGDDAAAMQEKGCGAAWTPASNLHQK